MGRREDKRELTRQQMFNAAAILFSEKGYESTSIEDVTEKADVSKGTFYYHFESKEALVVELRRSLLAGNLDEAMQLLEEKQPPLMILERLLLGRAAYTEQQPELSKVFFAQRIQYILFKEENQIAERQSNGKPQPLLRSLVYECVCEAQRLGQLRADLSPMEVTSMISAFFVHAQGGWLASDRSTSLVEKVHRWLHTILDGVAVKGYRDVSPCATQAGLATLGTNMSIVEAPAVINQRHSATR
jgi:AcrR family transcriptional regulator